MRANLLPVLFVLVALATSCQKELSTESGLTVPHPPPIPLGSDSNYIYKIYEIDSTALSGEDTFTIRTYFYDSQKRVVLVTDSGKQSMTSGPLDRLTLKREYFYNGTDSLPFKTKELDSSLYLFGQYWPYNYEIFHSYNTAGEKIKDSMNVIDPFTLAFETSVTLYTFTASNIFGYTTNKSAGALTGIETDTSILNASGSVLSNVKHIKDPVTNATVNIIRTTITYDNKISPFAKLSNLKADFYFPVWESPFLELFQKNNRLFTTIVSSGSTYNSEDLTGRYQYNAAGYPIKAFAPDPTSPGDIYKLTFVYKSL